MFKTVLTGLNGEPLAENGIPLTLADVAANALLSQYKDETPSGVEKVKRYSLALRIHADNETKLTSDDITLLKDLIGKAFSPLVVGQAWSILDPASVK